MINRQHSLRDWFLVDDLKRGSSIYKMLTNFGHVYSNNHTRNGKFGRRKLSWILFKFYELSGVLCANDPDLVECDFLLDYWMVSFWRFIFKICGLWFLFSTGVELRIKNYIIESGYSGWNFPDQVSLLAKPNLLLSWRTDASRCLAITSSSTTQAVMITVILKMFLHRRYSITSIYSNYKYNSIDILW